MKSKGELLIEFHNNLSGFSSTITHMNWDEHYLYDALKDMVIDLMYKLQFYETKEQKVDHYINLADLKIKDFKGCRINDIKLFDLVDLPEFEYLKHQGTHTVRQDFCEFIPAKLTAEDDIFDTIETESYTKALIIKCLVTENGFNDLICNKIIKEVSDYNNFELLSEVNKRILKKNNDGEK